MSPDYLTHEAIDRLHVVLSIIDEHLLSHPYITDRPELLQLIGEASSRLSDAYQAIGAEHIP